MVSRPSNQSSGRRGWIMLIDQGDDVDEDDDGGDAIWSK